MDALAIAVLTAVVRAKEEAPDAEDVVAGWTGFALFVFLILGVALIGWALTRSLKAAGRSEEAGVYDPEPRRRPRPAVGDAEPTQSPATPSGPEGGAAPEAPGSAPDSPSSTD